eukprot:gene10659-13056_t
MNSINNGEKTPLITNSSSFSTQVKALIKKTLIIKKKNSVETLMEIMYGLQYVIILAIFHFSLPSSAPKTNIYSPIPLIPFTSQPPFAYVSDSMNLSSTLIQNMPFYSRPDDVLEFPNESSLVDYYTSNPDHIWGGVIFNTIDLENNLFNYTIRLNNSYSQFQFSPYLSVKDSLLQAFTQLKVNKTVTGLLRTIQFPNITTSTSVITFLFPIYFPLLFLYSLQQLVILLVTEKQEKIKEAMKVMGLRESAYWVSNIATQVAMNIILIAITLVISYAVGIFKYWYVEISTFLDAPKTAGGASSIILILGIGISALYQFYLKKKVNGIKYFLFLFSPVSFGEFLSAMADGEVNKTGLSWSNSSFTISIGYLILDFFLYSLLAWYTIEIYQGEYGTGKGWLFFLSRDYWMVPQSISGGRANQTGISIRNLSKKYKFSNSKDTPNIKNKLAVNDLSFDIRPGTIFALLGHNGAGKSTTIGMLTGLMPPTSGDAYINGLSVTKQMDLIRQQIGLCPQHNILYKQLTCAEHLRLFARIKGIQEKDVENLVDTSLAEVNLTDKKDILSVDLSGGMKRRLCLAIAFIGDPPIVFLDECSSGLDPYSRHQIWSLLQRKKLNRTICITTHFMEEAELLGESIGIMSHGKLRCLGTSLELKASFGLGYIASLTFDRHIPDVHVPFEQFFYSKFKDAVPGKQNQENILSDKEDLELSYSLSHQLTETLTNFFIEIEDRQSEFSIKRISLSMTTLEEVFLRISEEEDHNDHSSTNPPK